MSSWLAIVNRCSGQYSSSAFEARWMPELKAHADRVVCTDAAGAASTIASKSRNYGGIVVVGGDGTIFEVIAGMDREHQQIGVIPTGRGNCLARDLGIRSIADGFRMFQAGTGDRIDLMQVEVTHGDGRFATFVSASTIALGYVVSVVDRADDFRAAGAYGYALATLVTNPRSFACRLAMAGDDHEDISCSGIVINNTIHLANFPTFTDAKLHDGLLDVLILDAGWSRQTLHNLSILSRWQLYDPGRRCQSKSVALTLSAPQTLMIDGQLYPGVTALSVAALPSALRCRYIPHS